MDLDVIFEDGYLIAINKPHGLLVHKSNIARDVQIVALQLVRDYVGKRVHLVHRLDRKTSGVLLFAKSAEITAQIQEQFINQTTEKRYRAIVRGYFPESLTLDYAIGQHKNKLQQAVTEFKCLAKTEIELAYGKFETSRYSLIEAIPKTGRFHQIRKHVKHLKHPIIGDRPHGCNKQNRFLKQHFQLYDCMLWAKSLTFEHPVSEEVMTIESAPSSEFVRMVDKLGFQVTKL